MFRALRRRASSVLCVSDFTKAELLRLVSGNGRPPVTVHNGIDTTWFQIPPAVSPHARPYLLYVGNIKPHKNVGTLIEAFRQIVGTIPHDLVIVGKRTGFITSDQGVMQLAAAVHERVRFAGELQPRELQQFVAHADAFVFPSLYEGFGFPPLEAMASGCPTIVARAASLPEVCGDASLYFDPTSPEELAAALTRLLSDARLRRELSQRGRQQAARFTWDRCSQETLAVMESVLAQ
jgi:glycosyltransferase involved in cell wall biosynthesis